jgi:hypothetical protein
MIQGPGPQHSWSPKQPGGMQGEDEKGLGEPQGVPQSHLGFGRNALASERKVDQKRERRGESWHWVQIQGMGWVVRSGSSSS